MIKILSAAVAVSVALLSGGALFDPAAAAEKPDLAIYGRLPSVEAVRISPDGTKLAIIVTDGDQRFLTIRQVGGSMLRSMSVGSAKLRDVSWADADNVLLLTSQTTIVLGLSGPKREYFMASAFNIVTGKQRLLLRDQPGSMNVVIGSPMVRTVNGKTVVFVEGIDFVNNRGLDTLFRIDLDDGLTRKLDTGVTEDTDGWLVDRAGEVVAQSRYDQEHGVWSLRVRGGGRLRQVDQSVTPMGSYGLSGFGRDGQSVLIWRSDEEHSDILREYHADGTHEDLPKDVSLSGLIHDPDTLALLGGYKLDGDDLRYTFFDAKSQSTWNAVVKAFGGDRVNLASWSRDRRKVVVAVGSDTEGPAYALVDLDSHKAEFLGPVYKDLEPGAISPVRAVKYKAADGLEISGYLTLPKGRDPKNLPLIVLPHGGPEGRDQPGFDWWSQALASRGYAVLQPNFRGSEGFGWSFVKAGFGEWGRKMQTDLSDGVRDLARQGIVDPKRVCIVGGSYGGYAALAGATLDKGVYRCAVSVAGPTDLKKFLTTNLNNNGGAVSASQRYWLRFMGADGLKDPDLAAISPARLADKVEIPILLIHGRDDTVVRYDQSLAMADALKRAGKPVNLVTLDGEDHWLSRGATRLKMLTETVAFLEKNNPPE